MPRGCGVEHDAAARCLHGAGGGDVGGFGHLVLQDQHAPSDERLGSRRPMSSSPRVRLLPETITAP